MSTVHAMRTALAHRRSTHRARVQLERELASYHTPSERQELDAILARHTAEEIAPLERILNTQSVKRSRLSGGIS